MHTRHNTRNTAEIPSSVSTGTLLARKRVIDGPVSAPSVPPVAMVAYSRRDCSGS